MERDPLIQPSPSFQQLRLAGEHHEQPHKQLIRPPIARPVLAGERKKERRKEREKRSPRGLEKRKKLQRKEGRGDTGRQGGALLMPLPSFFLLRLAGEHLEQPHKQLIRPPIARPVLAGERKKERRKEERKGHREGLRRERSFGEKERRRQRGHRPPGGLRSCPFPPFSFQ